MATSTTCTSGYELSFIDPVEDYECPLCLHVTREPSLTSCCGQHFCNACICRVISDGKPCPVCKSRKFAIFLDLKQKRRVHLLRVKCLMESRGCSWEGELGRLNNHLSVSGGDCMYIDVSCSYSCGVSMERRYLTAHCENDCFKRPSVCQYCNFEAMYFEICSEHSFFCSDFPVPCPNSCSIGTVERKNLEIHQATCPLASVSCEFEHAGCLEKIKRQDLPSHMELKIQHHLTLLSSLNLRLATSLSEKAVKVAKLEEQIVELETDRISQEEINSQQTETLEALEEQVEKFKQDRTSLTERIRKMKKKNALRNFSKQNKECSNFRIRTHQLHRFNSQSKNLMRFQEAKSSSTLSHSKAKSHSSALRFIQRH